ncbi:MAG: nitroreductase family protein, partial [Atribacterota bacterium]|nr:nitroreductase family protein [Atribacterota bacterium]
MEFQELIRQRHSVRAYKSKNITQEVLEKVLEAGRLAPTAANRQGFKIFVIKTDDFRDELKKIYPQE